MQGQFNNHMAIRSITQGIVNSHSPDKEVILMNRKLILNSRFIVRNILITMQVQHIPHRNYISPI